MHKPPTDVVFNEIRTAAIKIWIENYSNEYGYVTEKVNYIMSLENIQDNVMVFYRMFDYWNKAKLRENLSKKALIYIKQNE